MTILITSEKSVSEIQAEFNKLFPYLRIEFFVITSYRSKETVNKIPGMLTIGDATNNGPLLTVEISPCTRVKDFEDDVENKFGMYAQLYRKSGNLWQEITITDTWTMRQQDKTGSEISTIIGTTSYSKQENRFKTTLK